MEKRPYVSDWGIVLVMAAVFLGCFSYVGLDFYQRYKQQHQNEVVETMDYVVHDGTVPLTDLPAPPPD